MIKNDSEKLLTEHIDDLISISCQNYSPSFTRFLDGRQKHLVIERLNTAKHEVIAAEYGGFPNAERCIVGIFPCSIYEYALTDVSQLYGDFDIAALHIKGSGYRKLCHRDFLGSLLSLGIKRETVGDICVDDDTFGAYAVVTSSMADFICSNLASIANDKVKITRVELSELPEISYRFQPFCGTVASCRLDGILSFALGESREKSKAIIASGLVCVNHEDIERCDSEVLEGDILTVRGYGRFVVSSIGGETKKGRIKVTVNKML